MRTLLTVSGIALFLSLPPGAMAQQTATVIGTVSDATGALIPGVEVTATNNNTGISTTRVSGETGSYTLQSLQPGPYTITASLSGFSDATRQVNLTPNQTFRFNFTMQVGTVATAVEVVSDADALLATTGASIGDALPENEVVALPLPTRDVFDLLNTTAGLVRTADGDATNFVGTRNSAVATTRDGIPVSDGRYRNWNGAFAATYSSPDLVQEVQISVGTVDAAAGRGSSQVRLQTRSGTNEYHGALFWTTNNSKLNANNWFDNLEGNEKNWTNRNQYGGRIGGPIVRNKAFFFALIDNQEYRTRQNVTGSVLTEQARQGIFRYFPGVQNDDVSGGSGASVDELGNPRDWTQITGATGPLRTVNLFSNVRDPYRGTGISTNAYLQETLRRMPLPNNYRAGDGLNTAGFNWVRTVSGGDNAAGSSQNTNRKQLNVRLDYQITTNNKVNFVISRENNENDGLLPTWPSGIRGSQFRSPRIYSTQYTASITPRILNEFRAGYRLTDWYTIAAVGEGCCLGNNEFVNLTPRAKELFDKYYSSINGYPFLPSFATMGAAFGSSPWFSAFGASRGQASPLWTFQDNIRWVMGSHSFTAGWEGDWANTDGWTSGGLWPSITLGNGAFPLDLQTRVPGIGQNAGLAEQILNDLSGSVASYGHTYVVNDPARGFDTALEAARSRLKYHQDDWAAFFKDDWNVTRNLTLNYGVRWDVYGVPYEAKGLATYPKDFNILGISGPSGTLTQIIAVGKNSPNPDISVHPKDWNNIAPSFGFSYRVPWLNRTTVVRGGYGISYSGSPTLFDISGLLGGNRGRTASGNRTNPATYTALPGSTNAGAAMVAFPIPPAPPQPYETVQLTDNCRGTGCNLSVYAQDRRVPYIQNMNFSIETEVAPNTNLSVAWIGTAGTSLWGGGNLNEPNIYASAQGETFLQAFNVTRQGGNSALFAHMLRGINFGPGTCGTVNGTTCTASAALRQWSLTDDFFSDGEVAGLAEFMTETNQRTNEYGGLLRRNGYPENFLKLNPQFNGISYNDNRDHSMYHSLQAQLTRRLSEGFSGQFSYTWSKAIGNGGTSGTRSDEDDSFETRDPNNRKLQKGLLPFHRSHQFNAHAVWSLPFGPGRLLGSAAPPAVARIIEGWQLSSIFNYTTGAPLTVVAGAGGNSSPLQTLASESPLTTPDLVGSLPKSTGKVVVGDGTVGYLSGYTREADPTLGYYGTNPDSLEDHVDLWQIVDSSGNVVLRSPKPGTTGSLGTGWLTGPGRLGLDVAMSKSIQIREGTRFTIRMDAINVLNKPQWGNPNLNMFSNNFGRITNASGARTFTLNARIDF